MKSVAIVVAAAILAGCPSDPGHDAADAGPDGAAPTATWRAVLEGLDGSLLSMWGTSEKDVWTVGGSLGNGLDALVLRFDGTSWRRVRPGGTETYWWVHGTGPSDVWLIGEKGRITHWNGTTFEERTSGTTATLYGVFALAPDDAWAVGGTPEQPTQPNDVVLHWDGNAWTAETLPAPTKSALFKVWATSRDDLYVVGEAGVIWHRKAGAWAREGQGLPTGRLTTVTACDASHVFAVGGRDLLVSDGQSWSRATIDPMLVLNDLNGVACAPPGATKRDGGDVVVVGGGSLKLRLVGGAWQSDFGTNPYTDLHGAWIDPSGALWGVGGNFTATPKAGATRNGVVARYATDTVPSTLTP